MEDCLIMAKIIEALKNNKFRVEILELKILEQNEKILELELKLNKLNNYLYDKCFVYSDDSDEDNNSCGCAKPPQKECEEIKQYLSNIDNNET